ncbi:hypothetical protein AMJ57_01400 [Parcubacteria bacterium SG8_24]|nr:MAG: hypothetical protein AMJ57_01400 [Parcubacteria bacterium SG8_24]
MAKEMERIIALTVRLVAVVAVAAAVVYLAIKAVVPSGRLSVSTDLIRPAPYLSEPKPYSRLGEAIDLPDGGQALPLEGDPLYLDFTPPSEFDSVTLTLEFADAGHPLVEIGALASRLDGQYLVRPAYSRLLDGLNWRRLTSGDLTLFEREHTYASIDDFLRDPPDRSRLAVYRSDPLIPFVQDHRPSRSLREFDVSLRGHHRLYTYVDGEPLSFTFVVQDMNRQEGADPVIISVFRDGEEDPVARSILKDDGNTTDDQRSSKLREVSVALTDPTPGLYQVEFTAPGDVFIRHIRTPHRRLVFRNRLFIGDLVGYSDVVEPVTVYASGYRLVARTPHVEGLQRLRVGGSTLDLTEPQARSVARLDPSAGPVSVVTPARDVLLETDGLFALEAGDFFDPFPLEIGWYTTKEDLDAAGIDFILTGYESPVSSDGRLVAQASFDRQELDRTGDGAYRFTLSAPGVSITRYPVPLASVTVTMRREPASWRGILTTLLRLFAAPAETVREPVIAPTGQSYGEEVP